MRIRDRSREGASVVAAVVSKQRNQDMGRLGMVGIPAATCVAATFAGREVRRPPMPTWTRDELAKIAAAEELELAPLRRDDTLGNPVTIWVVRVGDDLYVRSWKGDGAAWFRAARVRHTGHIEAGGVGKDVTFVAETDDDVNGRIDAAYRIKYGHHGGRYVDPMVAPTARAATIKLYATCSEHVTSEKASHDP